MKDWRKDSIKQSTENGLNTRFNKVNIKKLFIFLAVFIYKPVYQDFFNTYIIFVLCVILKNLKLNHYCKKNYSINAILYDKNYILYKLFA